MFDVSTWPLFTKQTVYCILGILSSGLKSEGGTLYDVEDKTDDYMCIRT